MNKKGKQNGLTPRLRFPEFRDTQPWGVAPVDSLARVTQGGTPSTGEDSFWNGDVAWLTPAEMGKNDGPYLSESVRTVTAAGLANCSSELLPPASVILSTRAPIGHLAINTIPMAINQGCKGLIPTSDNDARFLYYTLLHRKADLADLGAGNTFKELSGAVLKSYQLPTTDRAEQRKIAACLGSLDDLIAAEERKLAALRRHKTGLMQQLFPRPGETQPRLRFPEFQGAGDWKENKLDDLAKRGTGHTPNKKIPEYYNGGIKWVSLTDSKRLDQGLILETDKTISEEGLNNSSAVLHPPGTVILSRDAGVGKSAVTGTEMAVSQHFIAWTCLSNALSNWFLYYLLQQLKPTFEQIATGSTIKTIGIPYFKAMRVRVPKLAEQHRIADCLATLGARLSVQVERVEALRQHKRGLMQQLFPAAEAR